MATKSNQAIITYYYHRDTRYFFRNEDNNFVITMHEGHKLPFNIKRGDRFILTIIQ